MSYKRRSFYRQNGKKLFASLERFPSSLSTMSVVDESLSEVRAQVKADVENLTRTVAEIDNDFSRIQEFVSGLDRTDLLTEKFEPRWRGLHDVTIRLFLCYLAD